ncbi:hypothetical protein CBR_g6459 [Chara braunii]|uniref:Uncharacterized protein n=1 Tax=Chara braunii TaxID=69332 RepID=A0A388KJV4_CHABU|nr:hypothetical protein CBR_g6459 [Chara braunii]|eukprot:GBG70331.1 hypothetical protein CBR_g6459 [Chara braunii]
MSPKRTSHRSLIEVSSSASVKFLHVGLFSASVNQWIPGGGEEGRRGGEEEREILLFSLRRPSPARSLAARTTAWMTCGRWEDISEMGIEERVGGGGGGGGGGGDGKEDGEEEERKTGRRRWRRRW